MSFVIDASILAAWFLGEKSDPRIETAIDALARIEACAPTLLFYEIRNALLMSERRRRITEGMSAAFLRDLALLPIRLEPPRQEASLMALAREWKLTVHDATYLELARRRKLPLATLDGQLSKAGKALGMTLLGT